MFKRRSQTLAVWFFVCDLAAVAAAWVAAYHVRFDSGWFPVTKDIPSADECYGRVPLLLVLAAVAFHWVKQYEVHRLRRLREELAAVAKGTALLTLLVMATVFYQQDAYESRGAMLLFSALAGVLVLAARRLTWFAVHRLRRLGYNPSFAVVVGTGRVARKTARSLRQASWMGIRVVGFVEDRATRWSSDLDILGTVADLPSLIEKYRIGHVFIALPMNRYHEARKAFDVVSRHLVEVRLVADVPALAGLSLTTANLHGMPLIGLRESPHFGLNVVVKRAMDVVLSLIALVLLAPVMAVIAAAVKATSPGPIIFRQERCGLNGQTFQMLKFRTLRVDAEAQSGPVWTAQGRRPPDLHRRLPAEDEPGRVATVLERVARRHEPGGTAAGAAVLHQAVLEDDPELHGPARRQGRHHGVGAGERLARQHVAAEADPVRPAVHHALESVARPADHGADVLARAVPEACVLTTGGSGGRSAPPTVTPARRPAASGRTPC